MKNRDMPAVAFTYDYTRNNEHHVQVYKGLTKREHFAGLAMQGLLSTAKSTPSNEYAREAVNMADALLEALEVGNEL